jgi:hypothetical protein
VGKTSLVCGLIAALKEFHWTAVKITSHDYGRPEPIWEETKAGQGTDTARYLAAGAKRALLVTVRDGDLGDGARLRELGGVVGPSADLIFESNAIAGLVKANVCLGVIGSGQDGTGMKASFAPFMRRMDAGVVLAGACTELEGLERATPVFELADLEHLSPEMAAWVRARLRLT